MQLKDPHSTKVQIFQVSKSEEEAFDLCKQNCPSPEHCPYEGLIKYKLTDEGLKFYELTDKFSKDKVFTLKCDLYKLFRLKSERSIRAKKILGYLFDHSFENFSPQFNQKAFETAKEYVSHKAWENGGWLILHGTYGGGKTHLLSAIVREAIISFGTKAKLVNIAKVSTLGFEEAKEELRSLSDYELIALDDVGVEISQNWLIPYIFKIFDDFNQKGGIVMSTNLSIKALQDLLGNRISDRIAENAIAVEMKGTSMRQNLRNKKISWYNLKGDD